MFKLTVEQVLASIEAFTPEEKLELQKQLPRVLGGSPLPATPASGQNQVNTVSGVNSDGSFSFAPIRDGVVKLWKRDGTPIMTLKGHATNTVNEVNWSFDGKFLATASSDRTVKLWQLDINLEDDRQIFNTLLTYNCDWLRDYFTTNADKLKSDRRFCNQIVPQN